MGSMNGFPKGLVPKWVIAFPRTEWPGQPVLQPRALPTSHTTRFLLSAVYFWK